LDGASLTVDGDLRAKAILDATADSYEASNVVVGGNMEISDLNLIFHKLSNSTVEGDLKINSRANVELRECVIGGSVWADNANQLTLYNTVVGAQDTVNNTAFVKANLVDLYSSHVYGYLVCHEIVNNSASFVETTAPAGAVTTIADIPAPNLDGASGEIKHFDSDGFALPSYVNLTMYNPTISAITPFTGGQLARLTLGNSQYWGVRAVPLRWVTPNKTVAGELVSLRNTGTTTLANTMTVAYQAMASKASLKSIGTILADGFDELNANPFDGFGVSDAINSIKNDFAAWGTFLSEVTKAVTKWAGLGFANQTDATYYRVSASEAAKLNTLRNGKDIMVVSRPLGTATAYSAAMAWVADFKSKHSILGKAVEKLMESLEGLLSNIVTEYSYRPVGVFFYESGYVPEGVFSSYYSKPTSKSWAASNYNTNGASEYRTASNKQNEMDDEFRWIWGGTTGAITSTLGDCTWTFFTCTDPTNPYGSPAKDLHIIIPKHTYMLWAKDSNSSVNIIGNGRVFLYLQEDTNIKVVGNGLADWLHDGWDNCTVGNWFNNVTGSGKNTYTVFGGVRAVGVDAGTNQTIYTYDASGNPVG
ncbi:MAG: hypothetical protein J5755_02560, partial [Clostridia bacterium]|nr:hypothetical protein [Clostridia bacterium]